MNPQTLKGNHIQDQCTIVLMTQFICLAIVFRKSEVIQQNKEGGKMSLCDQHDS